MNKTKHFKLFTPDRLLFYLFQFIISFSLVLGCNQKDIDKNEKTEDFKVLPLREVEIEMKKRFQTLEESLRVEDGIKDQKKIDAIIQLLINDGHMETPFIVQKADSTSNIIYVSYLEYKDYRSEHPIDTSDVSHTLKIQ